MIYLGGGFLPDVPARDLTDDEVNHYDKDELLISGLYQEPEKQEEEEWEQ